MTRWKNLDGIMLSEISQVEKDMASGPITSWQIYGVKVETVAEFIFLGSKITVDGDCGQEIKKQLLQPCGLCGRGRGWDDLGELH